MSELCGAYDFISNFSLRRLEKKWNGATCLRNYASSFITPRRQHTVPTYTRH